MIDSFIYDNLFHIVAGTLVIIFSSQLATSAKNVSGIEALHKLGDPRIFKIIGAAWVAYGLVTLLLI